MNKCVLLSVTDTNPEDQPFINFMENLITNLGTWHQTNMSNIYHQIFERGERLIDNELDRFYRVTKYFVNEIIHIPQEERCVYIINYFIFLRLFSTTLAICLSIIK